MRKKYQIVNIMFYFSVVIVSSTFAGGNKLYLREQRSIADNAFALVLAECDAKIAHGCFYVKNPQFSLCFKEKDLWHSKTFGEISANFSKGRFSYSRFHKRGQTVFNQLKALSCDHLKKVYQEHGTKSIDAISRGDWSKVSSATQVNQNVVVNYFVHHYLALQFAKTAGETEESGKEDLRRALVYEARAQSYLRNAFYAGHMLVPIYYPLFALHSRNIREAHDFYRNTGVFVINARGDAWQTFGGAILQTHEPTYRYILEAEPNLVARTLPRLLHFNFRWDDP